jgi:hypothetical protein
LAPEELPEVIESPKGIIDTGAAAAEVSDIAKKAERKTTIEQEIIFFIFLCNPGGELILLIPVIFLIGLVQIRFL